MSARLFLGVMALTRGWLHLYTCHVPGDLAQARRAEIESDLWEMQHDPDLMPGIRSSVIALRRWLDGIPDDLVWRFENAAIEEQLLMRRVFALAAAMVVVLSLLAVPSLFLQDRRDIASCAAKTSAPQERAAFRLEVMRCAGAFFSSRRD